MESKLRFEVKKPVELFDIHFDVKKAVPVADVYKGDVFIGRIYDGEFDELTPSELRQIADFCEKQGKEG